MEATTTRTAARAKEKRKGEGDRPEALFFLLPLPFSVVSRSEQRKGGCQKESWRGEREAGKKDCALPSAHLLFCSGARDGCREQEGRLWPFAQSPCKSGSRCSLHSFCFCRGDDYRIGGCLAFSQDKQLLRSPRFNQF